MLEQTSTKWAPWWVLPADHKWVTRALMSAIVTKAIEDLKLEKPKVTKEQQKVLAKARQDLLSGRY
jgi:hypothetical protein